MLRQRNSFQQIKKIIKATSSFIIGVDEVGRGCIAGPVCAGVVIFNPESKAKIKRYVDSKTLNESVREELAHEILQEHTCALGWASVAEVDQINIRQASLLAMKRAASEVIRARALSVDDSLLLIDGVDIIPNLEGYQQYSVIQGDLHIRQISAASIVAKVARDRLMKDISVKHPEYGFHSHKGYGTVEHRHAIQKFGVTEYHRRTFAGVKEYL